LTPSLAARPGRFIRIPVLLIATLGLARPALAQEAPQEQQPPQEQPPQEQPPQEQPPQEQQPQQAPPPPQAPQAPQTGTLTGTATSTSSGAPLAGAQVTIAGTTQGAIADENGRFAIEGVPPGTYIVEVVLAGYLTNAVEVTVAEGGTAELALQLADDPNLSEVIVVVGSRTERTVTQSPVPIDVISSEVIEESGETETNQILAQAAPSYTATHQSIADGSDHVNPAALRGLGPGQVLVLVNGKRRHSSALLHVNGTFGRGTVGVDLNSIPSMAIKRIEVLRDGASAQYGSDAIAGVINVELKDYRELATARAQTGITAFGDGFELQVGGNYGIPLGDGVVNVTGEFLQRSATDRSGPWEGTFYPGVGGYEETNEMLEEAGLSREDISMKIGQSSAMAGMLMLNAELPLGEGELYSFAGAHYRNGEAPGFYRRPNQPDRHVPEVYPQGYLPEIHTDILDWSAAAGYRQDLGAIDLDASLNHGGNSFLYTIENSINASLPDSPTSAYAGGPVFHQTTGNLDAVTEIPVPGIRKLGLAGGVEYRLENYQLREGDRESWECGPLAPPAPEARACGIQVFPGFRPENAVSEFRNNVGAYLGLESELSERFLLDVAGRFEYFSDFGPTLNGKLAGRWNMKENMALRAAVSTGFRAPALHQIWFNTVSTQFVPEGGVLVPKQVLTAHNRSAVAQAFGIPELEEETSLNVSAGLAARPADNLSLTIDAYRITIDDRIVLTSQFAEGPDELGQQVRMLLDAAGETEAARAQFFTNAVDTITRGIDVVADYTMAVADGNLGVTLSGNFSRTDVQRINVPQGVASNFAAANSADAVRNIVFNREEENRLEDAVPRARTALGARYSRGPLTSLVRASYYGPVNFESANPALDEYFGPKVLFDVDLGYKLTGGLKVSLGAVNLLNTMPDEQQIEANRFSEQFIYNRAVSQFGTNGGFYYLRLQYLM
jgi:iron complex outermembrane receptor protein